MGPGVTGAALEGRQTVRVPPGDLPGGENAETVERSALGEGQAGRTQGP